MAKLALLAVLASLLGAVSGEFSIYAGYGFPPPNPSVPYPLPPACPPLSPAPGLKVGHYADKDKCPGAEEIVREVVEKATAGEKAGLIRLFFHDCFVEGCDGSVLLSGTDTERTAFPNLSLRGFELIEEAKAKLEKHCPGIVSCADIVAFAGRDASYSLSYGRINYRVPAGRYDGKVSRANDTFQNLPPPFSDLALTTAMFAAKGLNQNEMVVLSGAHSIGRSACSSFPDRLPPAANSSTAMEPKLAGQLTATCSAGSSVNVPQDAVTPDRLDNQYYKNVVSRDVLFNSDASLTTSSQTEDLVEFYAGNLPFLGGKFLGPLAWYHDFEDAMVKMGYIGVKTSAEGEIRKTCAFINKS
ncbi:peroxidase 2-like [Lolium rigidum]|uniref:peroxidase 2-like n=1 Tax=Lolium rigidum TaxID=89674 RepID=UPI001F5D6360|nr:peroxidase 2-like [Lolium rigidum]XP_051211111.1 peroxidase 2-like [Lolium perenne]